MPDYNPPRMHVPVAHLKSYFLGNVEGVVIRCSCGWQATSIRPHQGQCKCAGCTAAENEFQQHAMSEQGALPNVY